MKSRRSPEHQKAVLERRRSNAAGLHKQINKYVDKHESIREELEDYKESSCM